MATCKVDGCTNESAGKGGSWHGMCNEHISEEGRRRQALRFSAKPPKEKVVRPVAPKPPPAAEPKANGNGHEPLSLTELARAVEQARANLNESVAALREALDAA